MQCVGGTRPRDGRGLTMSDRPSAVNGKRSADWGTRRQCPVCGQCLCFGCHPTGPCLDDTHDQGASRADQAAEPSRAPLR